MRRAGLSDRVTGLVASMDDLRFDGERFDLIWAEGSIYNIGFEKGLYDWRRLLKPGGSIAVTECSWVMPGPFPSTDFIRENFPDIAPVCAKLRILEQAGYAPLAHFVLPRTAGRRITSPSSPHVSRVFSMSGVTAPMPSGWPR